MERGKAVVYLLLITIRILRIVSRSIKVQPTDFTDLPFCLYLFFCLEFFFSSPFHTNPLPTSDPFLIFIFLLFSFHLFSFLLCIYTCSAFAFIFTSGLSQCSAFILLIFHFLFLLLLFFFVKRVHSSVCLPVFSNS